MSQTHTPGPWQWFDYPDGRKLLSGADRTVIHCPDAAISCESADAALIAAAPDLLVALKNLVRACVRADSVEELSSYVDGSFIDAARVAIEKAGGVA